MSIQVYTKLFPQIINHLKPKRLLFTIHKPLAVHLYRLHSTDINQQCGKDIVVYTGVLTSQLRAVKIFSMLTSVTAIIGQPILYKQLSSLGNIPLIVVAWSFFGFFAIGTPILLHLITKKYVTQLRYNPSTDSYIATTVNLLNFKRDLEFKPEDVRIPEVLGMFTSFIAKGKPLFVEPRMFEDPKHYGRIMGYDKPIDMKLYQTSFNQKRSDT